MSENDEFNDSQPQQPQEPQQPRQPEKEKVGDILHKERVTRRITLETIAKDLKLNVKYIKAIESNSFNDLPADPYVRVYLRSIANYLMLNPDEILRKFFEDRGLPLSEIDNNKTEKIKIDLEKETEKHSKSWIIIILVIAVLAALSYVSNKMGGIKGTSVEDKTPVIDSTAQNETELSDSLKTTEQTGDTAQDSLTQTDSLTTQEGSATNEEEDRSNNQQNNLKLVINAIKDSVWVQIFYDGVSWKNFIKAQNPRTFYAKDSINLHVGNNSRLRYVLNGKKLRLHGGSVKIFKIDQEGVEVWTTRKWKSVFRDRL